MGCHKTTAGVYKYDRGADITQGALFIQGQLNSGHPRFWYLVISEKINSSCQNRRKIWKCVFIRNTLKIAKIHVFVKISSPFCNWQNLFKNSENWTISYWPLEAPQTKSVAWSDEKVKIWNTLVDIYWNRSNKLANMFVKVHDS